MTSRLLSLLAVLVSVLSPVPSVVARTLYVSQSGLHNGPYTNWTDAATTIQAAVDAASPGDTVLVTNGTYVLESQIHIAKAITVESVNGATSTIVDGNDVTRCFELSHAAAVISGLTITGGRTDYGAGVYLNAGGAVRRCIITGNTANINAGGLRIRDAGTADGCMIVSNATISTTGRAVNMSGGGTVRNCLIADNDAYGLDSWKGMIQNCTIARNTGGGIFSASSSTLLNTIVYFNGPTQTENWRLIQGSVAYSCTTPLMAGVGNVTNDPLFVAEHDFALQAGSVCIDGGTNQTWMLNSSAVDGAPRLVDARVDMGAYEYVGTGALISLTIGSDGGVAQPDAGTYWHTDPCTTVYDASAVATQTVGGTIQYVCTGWAGTGSVPATGTTTNTGPFMLTENSTLTWMWQTNHWLNTGSIGFGSVDIESSWRPSGATVLITPTPATNAVFTGWTGDGTSGRELDIPLEVTVNQAMTIRANFRSILFVDVNSTNPVVPYLTWDTAATTIQAAVGAAVNGDTVLVTNGIYLLTSPISLRKGVTVTSVNGANSTVVDGNGVTRCFYLSHADAVVRGFTVTNGAVNRGAGVYFNRVGLLENCIIVGNRATDSGGGAYLYYGGILRGCLLTGNHGVNVGGGIYSLGGGRTESSTIYGNTSDTRAGGAYNRGTVLNTIIYLNAAPLHANVEHLAGTIEYSCTVPLLSGVGNIADNPYFENPSAGDFRLQPGSPCMDTGTTQSWMAGAFDLTGAPRIRHGTVDMGAFECAYTGVMHTVTVTGNPAPHGESVPFDYGVTRRAAGRSFTNTVPELVLEGPSRYTCTGWSGTGSIPATGETNRVAFTLNTDSSMTWNWSAEYMLVIATNGQGSVTGESGWYANGQSTTLTAAADTNRHRYFVNWTGTGLDGSDTDPVLEVTMDQPRTVTANFTTEQRRLVVVSEGGTVSPPVGTNAYDYGDSVQASTVATQVVGVTTQYVCLGWSGTGSVPASGNGTDTGLFMLTHDSTLVWNWQTRFWLDVAVSGAGHLNTTSAWHDNGTSVSITAVPVGDAVFTGWSGDVPVGHEQNVTLELTMDQAKAVTAHFYGGTRFVDLASTNPATPYLTWETAATDIQSAIDVAIEGDTVLVTNGVYVLSSEIVITTGITLDSVNGYASVSLDGNGVCRVVNVNNSNAVVNGFTISNGYAQGAGGVQLSKGLVMNCLIIANNAMWQHGAGARVGSGGILRQCVITGNSVNAFAYGGGVYCTGTALIESCTITGNRTDFHGGGICFDGGGTALNCIVWGNSSHTGSPYYPNIYNRSGGTVLNSFQGNPMFTDAANLDFRLQKLSPCIDAGANQAWMSGNIDFESSKRVIAGRVDIGAYEAAPSAFDLDLWLGDQPLEVTFTSYVSLTNMTDAYYMWDFDNDGTWDLEGYDLGVATNTYRQAGVYGVTLQVTNSVGEQVHVTRYDCVTVNQTLFFAANPADGANTLESVLTAYVTWPNQTGLIYSWDYDGDGLAETSGVDLAVVTNVFPVGLHTVSVTASNRSGTVATTVIDDYIHVVWDPIIPDRLAGDQPLEVKFSTFIPQIGMENACYRWDFDSDGTWDLEGWGLSTVTHTYLQAGVYSVSLTVTTEAGEQVSVIAPDCVTVNQTLFFDASPAHGTNALESVLTAYVTWTNQTGLIYSWDFDGDGHAETSGVGLAVVTNVFPVGLHTVSVTASNSSGIVATTVRNDYINVVIVDLNTPLFPGVPWLTEGDWEIGVPLSGPLSGYQSTNVAATGLDRNYGNNAQYRLISPGIALPFFTRGSSLEFLQLRYYEWFDIEDGYDFGRTLISVDRGATWTELAIVTGTTDWREVVIDLSAYNGSVVMLAFELRSDESITAEGWFIDDVRIAYGPDVLSAEIVSLSSHLFPYVYLNMSVYTNGIGIDSLSTTNFAVYEDGILQTQSFEVINPSENGNTRLADIVFIMDNSGSMSDEQAQVRENVAEFVAQLRGCGVDSALGLCRYGQSTDNGNPIIEDGGILTSDIDYFRDDVWGRNRVNGGREPGYLALLQVTSAFNYRPGSQKVFIIITDETPDQGGATMTDALLACEDAGAVVFALTLPSLFPRFEPITTATDGATFNILDDFEEILDQIATYLGQLYLLRYRSDTPNSAGETRRVSVEVTHGSNVISRIRDYIPLSSPRIERTPYTLDLHTAPVSFNTPLRIEAYITDHAAPFVQSAHLHYRRTGDAHFRSISMSNTVGRLWEASVPAGNLSPPGVDYFITATDSQVTTSDPSFWPNESPYQLGVFPNAAPEIQHTPITAAAIGLDLTISADVIDTTANITSVALRFRRSGELLYQVTAMSRTGADTYEGSVPAEFVTQDGLDYYIHAVDDQSVGSYHGTPDRPHTTVRPVIEINPLSFSANLMTGGTAIRTVTVSNSVHGSGALMFEMAPCSSNLHGIVSFDLISGYLPTPGIATNVNVRLNATGLDSGTYVADVVVRSQDPDEPSVRVTGRLTVTGTCDLSVQTQHVDLGEIFLTTSVTSSISVANSGFAVLHVTSATIDNPDYAVESGSFSLNPGESNAIHIVCTPSGLGSSTAVVSLVSNDPDHPTTQIAVTGTGVPPPVMDISPASISTTIPAGSSASLTLEIGNTTGGRDLRFDIGGVAASSVHPPDAFGYTWLSSDDPGGPSYDWYDISTIGSTITGAGDSWAVPIALPFDFTFYGKTRTNAWVTSDGYISFLNGNIVSFNTRIPSTVGPQDMIAVLWDALHPRETGQVFTYFDAGRRALIIQYDNFGLEASAANFRFQMQLLETGEILFYYHSLVGDTGSATVGIENAAGTVGLQILYNSAGFLRHEFAIHIKPPVGFVEPNTAGGIVPAGAARDVTLWLNAANLSAGLHEANIVIRSNDPSQSILTLPVSLTVTGSPSLFLYTSTIGFHPAYVGWSSTNRIRVANSGRDTLSIANATVDHSDFSLPESALELAPGAAGWIDIVLTPSCSGPVMATCTLHSNDPDEPEVLVLLTADATVMPCLAIDTNIIQVVLYTDYYLVHTSILPMANIGVGGELVYQVNVVNSNAVGTEVQPESGSVAGGDSVDLEVILTSVGVPVGTNGMEIVISSNDPRAAEIAIPVVVIVRPGDYDGDGDGMPDAWELLHGLNITTNDASVDADGEGATNLEEYIADTDPNDPLSVFSVRIHPSGEGVVFWDSSSRRFYSLWVATNLLDAYPWNAVPNMTNMAGSGDRIHFTNQSSGRVTYYRVGVSQ